MFWAVSRLADKPDFPRLADETKEQGQLQVEGREVGLHFDPQNEDKRRWVCRARCPANSVNSSPDGLRFWVLILGLDLKTIGISRGNGLWAGSGFGVGRFLGFKLLSFLSCPELLFGVFPNGSNQHIQLVGDLLGGSICLPFLFIIFAFPNRLNIAISSIY